MATDNQVIANVFNRMADYLNDYGWVQGKLGHRNGPMCIGAALVHTSRDHEFQLAKSYLNNYLWDKYKADNIPMFNDTCLKTQQEAVDFLRSLASELIYDK